MSTSRSLAAVVAAGALAIAHLPATARAEAGPSHVVGGAAASYQPALALDAGGTRLTPTALLATRLEAVDAFPIDADGVVLDPGLNVDLLARLGLAWTSARAMSPWLLAAELELDAFTGLVTDGPAVEGDGLPNDGGSHVAMLRKANATLSYAGTWTLKGGLMMSHWGLGLVANDGAHFWEPGSADFTDPRGGDRVLRGQLVYRTPGTTWLLASAAFDSVVADDNLLDGDTAYQGIGALMVGSSRHQAGLYFVARAQEAADGAQTDAYVMDLYGRTALALSKGVDLTLAAEAALIWGKTDLGATPDIPEHDLLRLGVDLRATLDAGAVGGVLDVVYASGDRNLDDDAQNAFAADPNFSLGMIAFPYVMAAQTGRAPITASNPELLGYPPDDLDRLPTRGAVSNTLAIYPRFWARPLSGLEIYGGPLFAFADVEPADPFHTRLAGGEVRNAYDAAPGTYLGTELDLGLRYRMIAWGSELTAGVEGAAFFPGDALDRPGRDTLGTLLGGRFMLTYKL